jgi:hypothetical protein
MCKTWAVPWQLVPRNQLIHIGSTVFVIVYTVSKVVVESGEILEWSQASSAARYPGIVQRASRNTTNAGIRWHQFVHLHDDCLQMFEKFGLRGLGSINPRDPNWLPVDPLHKYVRALLMREDEVNPRNRYAGASRDVDHGQSLDWIKSAAIFYAKHVCQHQDTAFAIAKLSHKAYGRKKEMLLKPIGLGYVLHCYQRCVGHCRQSVLAVGKGCFHRLWARGHHCVC